MHYKRVLVTLALAVSMHANAALQSEGVAYRDGDVTLEGYIVYDDGIDGVRPGVVVVHEWWGLNDYIRKRAEMLARLGYVALAVDMYGKGKVTEHPDKAGEWMQQITANVAVWQRRALLGLDILKNHSLVAPSKLAAIGYCFGGATVMQMAYSGADLLGVASFHGSLPVPSPDQSRRIRTRVFAAHGDNDAFVPPQRVADFKSAMKTAGVDLQFLSFPGVRHGFTNPEAGAYGMENLAYDAHADETSWRRLIDFFEKIFRG